MNTGCTKKAIKEHKEKKENISTWTRMLLHVLSDGLQEHSITASSRLPRLPALQPPPAQLPEAKKGA